jgi:hypothetical protein
LILLIVIVILGSVLRLYGLASLSLWFDEGATIHVAGYVDKNMSFLRSDYSNEAPLLPFLVHFWYPLVRGVLGATPGSTACDYLLRLLPCILGIVGIPLTFIACRAIVKDSGTALIAAFLFAVSPFQVYYAQELRPYSLYVAFSIGALFFMVKALEEDQRGHWIGFVICLVLSMYSHSISLLSVAVVNFYFVATLKNHKNLTGKWLLCQCIVLLLSIPALATALSLNRIVEQGTSDRYPLPDLRTALITFKTFFAGYSSNHLAYRALFLIAGFFFISGIHGLRSRWNSAVLLAGLAIVPVASNVVIWRIKSYPFYEHRTMIFCAVACYMLVALGIRALKKKALVAVALSLVAGLSVPCLADHYAQRLHPSMYHRMGVRYKLQNREAAHYIAERLAEADFVGHTSQVTLFSFCYYLSPGQTMLGFTEEERLGIVRFYPNIPAWEHLGFLPVRIESATETPRRIWLVQSSWETFDLDPLSRQLAGWLDGHCLREERKAFDGVTVYLYTNDPELKAATKTNQLADYGNRTVPYYLFPEDNDGLSAGTEWRRRFLATFLRNSDEQPDLYGLQFDLAVAHEGELSIQDWRSRTDFTDDDGDGERETLSLTEIGALVREEGTTRIDSVDYSVLAMDGDRERAVLASFPLDARDDFTYRFVVRNATDVARTVRCSVHESAHVIEPLAFSRSDPESDVWRPTLQYNFGPPPEFFNKLAMVARLTDKSPGGDSLYNDVHLDRGHYTVFVRMLEEANPVNKYRASLRFNVIPSVSSSPELHARLIGEVKGNDPSGAFGWTWRRVGEFRCDGEPFRLVVAAYNDDNLPKAYFDLDRVMFVRAEDHTPSSPVETERSDVTLRPFEEKTYTISGSLGEYRSKRIDIELFDTVSKEFRNIFFHVRRDG